MSATIDFAEHQARAEDGVRAPLGGRPATATLTLGAGGMELPGTTELAGLLVRAPVAEVRLAVPADFSAVSGRTLARIIALVRECSSVGARVAWSLTLRADQLDVVHHLGHLPAPTDVAVLGGSGTAVEEWRSTSEFGLLYFRRGPGFLSVLDRRSGHSNRSVLDDPVVVDVFHRGLAGCAWDEVTADPGQVAAAQDLVSSGLLMRVADHCVTLPIHMRSWPVGTVLLGGTLASAGSKDAPERL